MIRNRDIQATLGALKLTVNAVHQNLNDRPPGAPSISVQVAHIDDKVDTVVATLASMTSQISNRDRLVDSRLDNLDTKVDTLTDALAAHVLANPGLPAPPPRPGRRGPAGPKYGA